MKYRYLLFDADDTLFDFHQASLEAFAAMCRNNDIPNTPEVYQIYYDINHALWAAFDRGEVTKEYLTLECYVRFLAALGLERDALGDVVVQDPFRAVVFCSETIGEFLLTSLTKVASDTVRCTRYVPDEGFTDGIRYQPIRDTIASPRLDCVVAALTNLSRENAQNAIRSGLVEVDFEPTERTDLQLTPPATLSIRGHGRFVLRAFDGETRKGRLRMIADKRI